jgi:hypothetical protein
MVAAFVLIVGVLLIMMIAALVFKMLGTAEMLGWILPWAPMLVMIGTFLLIMTELLLFFGGKEDRRTAWRDLGYLFPTFLVSGALWYLSQHYLW